MDIDTYEREGVQAYAKLAETIANILAVVVANVPGIRLQQIQHRAKEASSLRKKLDERSVLSSPMIETEVKDLAGCRIIFYTNADVEAFVRSQAIFANFEVDWDRTKFHYPASTEAEEGFYISYNYVVRLKDDRAVLPEYAALAGLWCEIQVQTTLDHAWSEMSHDTTYKPPVAGFGTRMLEDINKRTNAMMRKYLRPAGFDFQKIADDARRLRTAHEFYQRDPLRLLREAANNNDRYDLLKQFAELLAYYDDLPAATPAIRAAMAEVIEQARDTAPIDIVYPGGSFAGHSSEDVVTLALDVIDAVRFVSLEDVTATLDHLLRLYPGTTSDGERTRFAKSADVLSENSLAIWQTSGPIVQSTLVDRIEALSEAEREAARPIVLKVLENALSTEVEGTIGTYNSIIIQQGAVRASDALRQTRSLAVARLSSMLMSGSSDAERRLVISALGVAERLPGHGATTAELMQIVFEDAIAIATLYRACLSDLSFELRQELEHHLLWTRRRRGLPPEFATDQRLATLRDRLDAEILAFRDAANADQEFVIYKTLVGYQSVFPHEWEDANSDYEHDQKIRAAALDDLIGQVTAETFPIWRQRIQRVAATRSDDGATFPPFRTFLQKVGEAHPQLAAQLLADIDDDLDRFLDFILFGLDGGDAAAQAREFIERSIADGKHLAAIASYCSLARTSDPALLVACLARSVEKADAVAVTVAMEAAARRMSEHPELVETVILTGARHLAAQLDYRWLQRAIYLFVTQHVDRLTEAQADELLQLTIAAPRIDYPFEELLRAIGGRWPTKVLDFFGDRVRYERTLENRAGYDDIPFTLHRVNAPLQTIPAEVIERSRAWFAEEPALFSYRGGSLISRVFTDFAVISDHMRTLVSSGDDDDIRFTLEVLRRYEGQASLHPICQDIVELLPEGDSRLETVGIVLDESGVMRGDFGIAEAAQFKRQLTQSWLDDPRPKVRAFAERRLRQLERSIAAEQRRATEELEFRKRHYGEGAPEESSEEPNPSDSS